MFTIAILTTLAATALLIATAVAYHVQLSDERRTRAVARMKSVHLRHRGF